MSYYEVIDNAIDEQYFLPLESFLLSHVVPWNYCQDVSGHKKSVFPQMMFTYIIYSYTLGDHFVIVNDAYNLIRPVLSYLKPKSLIRIKANMYPNQGCFHNHPDHVDYEFSHKSAILYLNNNDGFTVLHDGTKIESKRNRLLLFDGSKPHHSTNCTDDWRRININFNYF